MRILSSFSGLCLLLVLWAPSPVLAQATGTITGVVTSEAGQPLASVQISIPGTRLGVLTRADGRYLITGVPAGQHQVRATLIGYGTQEETVTVVADETATVDFRLAHRAVELEGIVAVGYGVQQRRDITGAISSVNADVVRTPTTVSVEQLLQGQAAGVEVTQSTGAPGGAVSVRIRGTSSITANSEPLYVIDGVPAFVGSGGRAVRTNPLAEISPNDIQSIEVLKDASATAIYGSRGANGVVLITTKRGQRGENIVRIESNYGVQQVGRTIPMLNAREFAELNNEARINAGMEPRFTPEQIAQMGEGTDWQSEIFRTAPMQNHSVSVAGGDERTRYHVSGSLFDQDGVVINSGYRRYSGRLNLDREVRDQFRIGSSVTASRSQYDLVAAEGEGGRGVTLSALEFSPIAPVRDSNGNYVPFSPANPSVNNPVATALEVSDGRTSSRLLGNLFAEYDLTDALRFRSSLGGSASVVRAKRYAPSTVMEGAGANGDALIQSVESTDLVNENILTYRPSTRAGDNLDFTGGFTVQTFRSEMVEARTQGFGTDITGANDLSAGARPLPPISDVDEWTLLSWLGRANYNLRDRYLFTVTARYDGSSKFGERNKWGFFPSAAFGWRLSEEAFLRRVEAISDAKLRVSYGITGNQEIGTYASLARLQSVPYVLGGTRQVITYAPAGQAPNPDLRWESTRQFGAGLDLGFFDNRILITTDFYNSVTDDLLLLMPQPSSSGFDAQLRNVGSVRNRGVELGINTTNLERANLTWRTTLNLSRNWNQVVDLGGPERILGPDLGGAFQGVNTVVEVGQPLGTFFGFRTNGVWQEGDPCTLDNPADCTPGEIRFVDTNGDGKISAADRVLLGKGYPDLFGGLTNNFTFGPLSLDVLLQGSLGNEILNLSALWQRGVTTLSNEQASSFERWTPQNPSTSVPRANVARTRRLLDRYVEDGSYLRLQNVTLGYTLPQRLVPGVDRARLYVSGQNLWTWTNYTGFDPEVNSYGGDATHRGLDQSSYPRARTLSVGVSLDL
jgi:TonB-linked SusC/RagA family outer membrane protein